MIIGKNGVATFSQLILIKSFSYMQVTMIIHKSLDEFEIWPDLIRDHRALMYVIVTCKYEMNLIKNSQEKVAKPIFQL